MGIFSKAKRAVGKIAKPFSKAASKFSQKFIPRELRPFLPLATPFLPAMGIMGQLGGPMGFAKMYGANLLGQQLADPDAEFDDLNQFAALLSGTQGGLTNTGTAQNLRDMTTQGKLSADPSMITKEGIMKQMANAPVGSSTLADAANRSMLTKAKDLGLEGLASASDYLTNTTDTLQDIGSGRIDLFSGAGAKEAAKAAAVPFSTGMGGVTEAFQRPIIRQFKEDEAAEAADIERTTTANEQERADLQMQFMREANISEDEIKVTLDMNDLSEYYTPPTESAAQGGIIGLKEGGMLNFGGREMDLRTGGFVPIGKKERADDVPARLSKNEFVMTADAVRAAGGGSVNKGAQRMYDVMNKLEARA